MKITILFAVVLIGTIGGQVTGPGTPSCPPNETFHFCGTCDASCSVPTPTCEEPCTIGCLCDAGFVRDNNGRCVKPVDCPNVITCGANEVLSTCYNACEEPKCLTVPGELCPIPIECLPGCACKRGFVRNAQGQCIKESQCVGNPCEGIRCPCGETCVVVDVCGRNGCTSTGECQPIGNKK